MIPLPTDVEAIIAVVNRNMAAAIHAAVMPHLGPWHTGLVNIEYTYAPPYPASEIEISFSVPSEVGPKVEDQLGEDGWVRGIVDGEERWLKAESHQ